LETRFDLHCVRVAGVDFVGISDRESLGLGIPSTECQATTAVPPLDRQTFAPSCAMTVFADNPAD
jgi:hypothetical protein